MVARLHMPSLSAFEIRKGLLLSFFTHVVAFSLFFFAGSALNGRGGEPIFYVELGEFGQRPLGYKLDEKNPPIRLKEVTPQHSFPEEFDQRIVRAAEAVEKGENGETPVTLASGMGQEVRPLDSVASSVGKPNHTVGSVEGSASGGAISDKPIETRFGDFEAPFFLHREIPEYPPLAQRLGREGKVVLALLIDHKGELKGIEVLQGADFGFTEAAVKAVKKSTFSPAKKNGQAVSSRALLVVRFQLD